MPLTLKISAEELAKRHADMEQALASVRLEGLEPSPEVLSIYQRHAEGEISLEDARKEIEAMNDRKYGPVRLPRD
jgi:hypothetical protein